MRSQKYFAAIRNRAHAFPLPPPNFDRFGETNDNLAVFGIPPKPARDAHPELRGFWDLLMSNPFNPIIPHFPRENAHTAQADGSPRSSGQHHSQSSSSFQGRGETSRNWSGFYITPTRPARFSFMTGRWRVPMPVAPKVLPDSARPNAPFKSTIWIGFDGHRSRYPHASLPQIGTSLELPTSPSKPAKYAAWWQWWMHDPDPEIDPENASVDIENMVINPCDEILTCMHYRLSSRDMHFVIKNQTTGQFCAFIVIAPGQIDPIGSTAEWVVERPTEIGSDRMETLPNYGSVDFTHCLAQANDQQSAPAKLQCLAGNGRRVRMVETFASPQRTAIVSVPTKLTSTSFRCNYQEPGAPRTT